MDEIKIRAPQETLFDAPLWQVDEPRDVIVFGVPSDLGMLGVRSTAGGPGAIRAVSRLFPLLCDEDGRGRGWFDYAAERLLLSGVSVADAGDFPVDRRQGMGQLDALPEIYGALARAARLVVILGGDHASALWLGRALEGDGLIWIDGHEDAGPVDGPYPHHANVITYLDECEQVGPIVQVGLRGIVSGARAPAGRRRRWCRTPDAVADALLAAGVRRAAVSIDVDVFDPSIMPSVSSPLPEGLAFAEVIALLRGIASRGIEVRFLEITEFAPQGDADRLPAMALAKFLLRAIAACLGQ